MLSLKTQYIDVLKRHDLDMLCETKGNYMTIEIANRLKFFRNRIDDECDISATAYHLSCKEIFDSHGYVERRKFNTCEDWNSIFASDMWQLGLLLGTLA